MQALMSNNFDASNTKDIFNDNELAQRKVEEASILSQQQSFNI